MVNEGIVLGHKIYVAGLEVDQAKVYVIETLMPPLQLKGLEVFWDMLDFKEDIKDFSKISRPLCRLLEKDAKFDFDESCRSAFEEIKTILVITPIMVTPDWNKDFEIMCDANDYAMGAVLGQRTEKIFRAIYYASKTFNENYSNIEKEMLAIIFSREKLRPYILGSHVIIHTDHEPIKYLMAKKDAKPRLIIWGFLLQEFDSEIKDKKGSDTVIVDHLSRLEKPTEKEIETEIEENFPNEQLFQVLVQIHWYADIVNYLAYGIMRLEFSY